MEVMCNPTLLNHCKQALFLLQLAISLSQVLRNQDTSVAAKELLAFKKIRQTGQQSKFAYFNQ